MQRRDASRCTASVHCRTMRSTGKGGARAGVNRHKGVRGSKDHAIVDTVGTVLRLSVTPGNEAGPRSVGALAQRMQQAPARRSQSSMPMLDEATPTPQAPYGGGACAKTTSISLSMGQRSTRPTMSNTIQVQWVSSTSTVDSTWFSTTSQRLSQRRESSRRQSGWAEAMQRRSIRSYATRRAYTAC